MSTTMLNRRLTENEQAGQYLVNCYTELAFQAAERGDDRMRDWYLNRIGEMNAKTETRALQIRMEES